jgi:hypothetical protein
MTERVKKLREQSVTAIPRVSLERALLMTEYYQEGAFLSPPVRRAMAFKYIMEKKEICLNDGELIVGERGPAPKATYTFPELCCHTLEDLDILNSSEKVWFRVSDETKQQFKEKLIPFWKGKTIREKIFEEMTEEWKEAYAAGIFTEFMEQRAPGHTALDGKIYRKGMLGFKKDVDEALSLLDFIDDPEAHSKSDELKGMKIRSHGMSTKIVSALGATPVAMPMSDSYDALQRGVTDGIICPLEALEGWKLGEVVKSTTQDFSCAYTSAFFVTLNKDKWNSLPPDTQKIIEKVNEEWIEPLGKIWDEIDKSGREFTLKLGNQIISLPKEEEEKWTKATRPIFDEYVTTMKAKGLPAEEALKFCQDYLKKNQ